MYGTARSSDKAQACRIACHFVPLFIASLALTISTGIYLFDVEEVNYCSAPKHGYDAGKQDNYIDVSRRFFVILIMFFAYYFVQCVRALLVLLSLIPFIHVVSFAHTFLFLNELLGLASLALAHIFRFQYAGRYCACKINGLCNDNNQLTDTARSKLLIRRGEYILGLIIVSWVYIVLNWCMHILSIRRVEKAANPVMVA